VNNHLNRGLDFFGRLVVVKLLNGGGSNTSKMRRHICRRLRHCNGGSSTASTSTSVGRGRTVGVHTRSGGTESDGIKLSRVIVAKHDRAVVLDDVVTIINS
jgi:hypothetical protein